MHKYNFFSIVVEPCEEGGYFASCSLLQGCHAEGETYGEAIDNIHDVIKLHLEIRKKKGDIVPLIQVKESTNMNFQVPLPVEV